jgi:hypothetical protein
LLGAAGIDAGTDHSGRDLFADDADDVDLPVYLATYEAAATTTRSALVTSSYKLIVSAGSDGPAEQLFSIGNETIDLAASQPAVLAKMRAAMERFRGRFRVPPQGHDGRLSPADREKMRALGYLDGD